MECVKATYRTKEEATRNLEKIRSKSDRGKKPLRVYRCSKCKKWHLTSFTKKKQKEIKEITSPESKQKKRVEKLAEIWIKKNKWDSE
jgi:flagellar biosynthesis chaperone FliJ